MCIETGLQSLLSKRKKRIGIYFFPRSASACCSLSPTVFPFSFFQLLATPIFLNFQPLSRRRKGKGRKIENESGLILDTTFLGMEFSQDSLFPFFPRNYARESRDCCFFSAAVIFVKNPLALNFFFEKFISLFT